MPFAWIAAPPKRTRSRHFAPEGAIRGRSDGTNGHRTIGAKYDGSDEMSVRLGFELRPSGPPRSPRDLALSCPIPAAAGAGAVGDLETADHRGALQPE